MTERRESEVSELQIKLGSKAKGWATVAKAIEQFFIAAHPEETLGAVISRAPRQASGAEFHAELKRCRSRAAVALKMVELPPAAANPTRVRKWLESSPHISLVFSPLKERGPPRP